MTANNDALPELPKPRELLNCTGNVPFDYFTSDQMRDYARAAIRALSAERGEAVLVAREMREECDRSKHVVEVSIDAFDDWCSRLEATPPSSAEREYGATLRALVADLRESADYVGYMDDARIAYAEAADKLEAAISATSPAESAEGDGKRPVAWYRSECIRADDGTPIGTDEPSIVWGSDDPDPGMGWRPLYEGWDAAAPSQVSDAAKCLMSSEGDWTVLDCPHCGMCVTYSRKEASSKDAFRDLCAENASLRAALEAAQPQPGRVEGSLLRSPNATPQGCHCQPGKCMAPLVMGRQTACLDPAKANGGQS